jgi:tetratricopeptide (TPR) repeat protein
MQESDTGLLERMRATTEASTVQELPPSEAAKGDGNAAFKRRDWATAVEHYSKALQLDENLTVARNNRAMAHLKLQNWREAETDCSGVLEAEPSNAKALLRRATARSDDACIQICSLPPASVSFIIG